MIKRNRALQVLDRFGGRFIQTSIAEAEAQQRRFALAGEQGLQSFDDGFHGERSARYALIRDLRP